MLGTASILALAAASGAFAAMADITPQEKKLIDAANTEGAVVFINPLFQESTAARVGEAFKKRYGLNDSFEFRCLTSAPVGQTEGFA